MKHGFRRALPVLLFVTIMGLFSLVLSFPPTWTLDVGMPGDTRFISGFFKPERGEGATFRWSSVGSRLTLHGANVGTYTLAMRAHGGQPDGGNERYVSLERGTQALNRIDTAPGWRVYSMMLPAMPANLLPTAQSIEFGGLARPTVDGRQVSLAFDRIWLAPARGRHTLVSAPVGWSLLLTWGVAVFSVLAWRGDRRLFRNSTPWFSLARVLALTSAVVACLLGLAMKNPYVLAWALPTMPWTLGIVTLGLLARPILMSISTITTRAQDSLDPRLMIRLPVWIGVAALGLAQVVFYTGWSMLIGALLSLIGLALLLNAAGRSGTSASWLWPAAHETRSRSHVQGLWRSQWVVAGLGMVFVVALALRFYQLSTIPYGMWRDEARHGIVALRMLEDPSYRPIYVPEVDLPALGLVPFAFALKVWGIHPWSMRPVTAFAGALTIFPLYALVYQLSARRGLALLSASLLAVSSWHLSISRLSFPHVFDPLLLLSGLWLLLVGLTGNLRGPIGEWRYQKQLRTVLRVAILLLAGLCLGLALHTYHTGRLAPFIAGLLALLVLGQRPHNWRRWLVSMIVVGVGYTIVAGPLLLYSLTLVSSFNERVSAVFVFSESALKARPPLTVFDEAVGRHLLMFNVRGDGNGRHHAPNRPMLDFLTGLGFIVGCGVLARGWQDWRARFLLGGLALGLLPSFLAVDAPHALRSLHAAAFACVLAAVGWIEIGRLLGMPQLRVSVRGRMLQAPLSTVFSTVLVVLALSLNARTYLIAMPADEAVWKSFYPTHTRIGEYLRATLDGPLDPPPGLFYVSAGMAANSVLRYLDHGLSVATFDGAALSTAATPGAHFVLSGYTYQRDEQLLRAALRYDFVPTLYGPPLPDGKTPSFVIYTIK